MAEAEEVRRRTALDTNGIERRAAAAVSYALGARAHRRDFGGSSLRDYDVVFLDGSVEPLEVTIYADEPVIRTGERLRRADRRAPSLKRYWALDIPNSARRASGAREPYDVLRFFREAEPALREIEEAGHERFDLGLMTRDPRVEAAIRRLARLGCDFGFSHELPPGQPGQIRAVAGVGGVITEELIPAAIELEAAKSDNQAKLSEPAYAMRRHLVVIVDSSTTVISAAHRGMVGRVPTLPVPITTAWIVGAETVYFVTPPGAWESVEIPREVFEHPERWITD